jgi:hypothetical protein
VDTVAAYLASLARAGLKASTITRRCAGIRYMHRMAGLEPPTSNEAIKAVLAGIRRSIGTAATRKAPAAAETIRVREVHQDPKAAPGLTHYSGDKSNGRQGSD